MNSSNCADGLMPHHGFKNLLENIVETWVSEVETWVSEVETGY